MRKLLLLLVAACSAPAPTPAPTPTKPKVPDSEPDVRVHLRSYGEWTQLRLKGKGGLFIEAGDARLEVSELTIVQAGKKSMIQGVDGKHERVAIRSKGGVFSLGSRTYSGTLVLDQGRLVNVVPLENYVLGVLRGEIPLKEVPVEAARAQAIAVRSYTLHYLLQNNPLCDVDDTTLFQVYAGLSYAPDDKSLRKGVNSTRGVYLDWQGEPLKAYYHSTCGGHTTDVVTGLDRNPVLCMEGVPCDFCKISKYYRWQATVPEAAVLRAMRMDGRLQGVKVSVKGNGERARRVLVTTDKGDQEVHANAFRLRVGPSKIRSTRWLNVQASPQGLFLEGAGWGHGVGMCQMGAIGRAQAGAKGEQIVLAYYAGAKLKTAY
ncbi:MAG: SpoIID/LytB domain-containing protein [Planctomycetota bacterium]|jgi:stage II sporulation protein D